MKSAQTLGLTAHRVPLSGALADFPGDVVIVDHTGEAWTVEAKKRASGFKQIYSWLEPEHVDVLVIGADRATALAVLPLDDWLLGLSQK